MGASKKGPRNRVNSVTQLVHTRHVLDLLTVQMQWLSCLSVLQHHHQRTAVVRLPQFAAPQAARWERCTTPPTAGLALPDKHDS